jgi:Gram-negative bacterial TonB protein C-terminal
MISKNLSLLLISVVICLIFPTHSNAQRKRFFRKTKTFKKPSQDKTHRQQIFSGGVLNGKALSLVRPEFSQSAKSVGARGTVSVQVLIDENGDVTEAKALRGNPLFIANSIKAAKLSKFQPFVLENGNVLRVSGVIIYNYTLDRLNWLEIGYSFSSPNYLFSDKLEDFLPTDFTETKQLMTQSRSLSFDEQAEVHQTVSSLIEGKLSSNNKNLWLFSLGKELGKLSNNYWIDKNETLLNIQNLLFTIPATVSPNLKISIEKLILSSKKNTDQFNNNLTSLIERLYGLGN